MEQFMFVLLLFITAVGFYLYYETYVKNTNQKLTNTSKVNANEYDSEKPETNDALMKNANEYDFNNKETIDVLLKIANDINVIKVLLIICLVVVPILSFFILARYLY